MSKLMELAKKAMFYVRVLSGYEECRIRSYRLEIEKRIAENARPPLPASCPRAFRELITRCWSSKPDKRPSFDEIVEVLEGYAASVDQDPNFFASYEPGDDRILFR